MLRPEDEDRRRVEDGRAARDERDCRQKVQPDPENEDQERSGDELGSETAAREETEMA